MVLMDESSRDNCLKVSFICGILKDTKVENYTLVLLPSSCYSCNTEIIFHRTKPFLKEMELHVTRIIIGGMDVFSTISGQHNGFRSLFEKLTSYLFSFISITSV